MIDDEGLEIYANLLGMFIMFLLIVYHYVTADPNYGATENLSCVCDHMAPPEENIDDTM